MLSFIHLHPEKKKRWCWMMKSFGKLWIWTYSSLLTSSLWWRRRTHEYHQQKTRKQQLCRMQEQKFRIFHINRRNKVFYAADSTAVASHWQTDVFSAFDATIPLYYIHPYHPVHSQSSLAVRFCCMQYLAHLQHSLLRV